MCAYASAGAYVKNAWKFNVHIDMGSAKHTGQGTFSSLFISSKYVQRIQVEQAVCIHTGVGWLARDPGPGGG